MALSDLPIDELVHFRPDVPEPADFDAFWAKTIADSRAADRGHTLTPAQSVITELLIEDLVFSGFAGDPVHAWVTRPARETGPSPTVVEFIEFGGGRGLPGENIRWAAAGFVHVLMDTRGQGSRWGSGGHTPDPHGSGASVGFMTRGILDPHDYYYRRLFTDGVRLVDTVRGLESVDASKIALTGASQGGGISIAVAALHPDVIGVMPDVPFLANFPRAVALTDREPFSEIATYLAVHRDHVDEVFATLSYMDGVNFARRVTAPALFSVALMDRIVLPSTVYSAYNHLGSPDRQIEVYAFNDHEGGQSFQWVRQVEWLRSRLG